jgi:hypothetical protein
MANRWGAVICASALLASCANMKDSGAKFGCKVSPERAQDLVNGVCVQAAASNDLTWNGEPVDFSKLQGVAPTIEVQVPIKTPEGEIAGEVACSIKTRTRSVVYAHILRGPTTQAEADYIRSQGGCSEP